MTLIRVIIEVLSVICEYECPFCGIHYRAEGHDPGCAVCANGAPTARKNLERYEKRGNRQEQAERMERVYQLYKEKYLEMGDETTGYIAKVEKLKLQTVQGIIRRKREGQYDTI